MQVVILAGGLGTRLRPMTNEIPKVMVDISGKPFLLHLLELLRDNGLGQILILIGYLGNQIKEWFGNGENIGLSLSYSLEEQILGTGGAIKNAEAMIASDFLLINGDTYLDINYTDFIQTYYKLNKKCLMCVYTNKRKEFDDNILIGEHNRIIKYNKISPDGLSGVDAGASIFKKEVLNLIPANKKVSLEDCVYQKLISENEFFAYPTDTKFLDIGSFEILKIAKEILP